MTSREKLFKLMQENPDLPIVFCCSTDEMDDSYSSMFYSDFSCDLVTIYRTEDKVFDHIVDITEYYEDLYEDEYEDLSKEEFDKKIKELVEDTFQYKAIRIYCS